MTQRMLITGGSGYFGCLLRDRLLDRGDMVRIFDLNDSEDRPDEVEFQAGDVRDAEDDPPELARGSTLSFTMLPRSHWRKIEICSGP